MRKFGFVLVVALGAGCASQREIDLLVENDTARNVHIVVDLKAEGDPGRSHRVFESILVRKWDLTETHFQGKPGDEISVTVLTADSSTPLGVLVRKPTWGPPPDPCREVVTIKDSVLTTQAAGNK